ncbi:MAG: prepilin-type N-terminal cleavage/methylation domain-containing protein [Myxococcales bacterium]|nr:prepilin-type N-terminal cleavage/methylation domain-containing protein [Myxococcales bacterium]MCB9547064.1 prepilin-type N-terminal cleavage/methylation domain-containing protein [Myxococcales bacterium]
MTQAARRRTRRAGFTMIELMMALLLSSIVLLAIYFVFISNTEQYYRQEQIVQMQETMRFALEHLKTDLRNAGRLTVVNGTPQGTDAGFCRPQANLTAVQLFDDEQAAARADFPAILANNGNQIRPDRLRLLVDASGATPVVTRRLAGRVMTLQPEARQPTRDGRALVAANAQARFTGMFQAGHYLYISAMDSRASDLVPITDVRFAADGSSITLSRIPCLPPGTCEGRCTANPVQLVEYAIVGDAASPAASTLERRVISAINGQILAGSQLVLADHAIDMQFWGTYDTRANAAAPPVIGPDTDPSDTVGNWPGAATEAAVLNIRPERVRSLNVLLATRTPRADPAFNVQVPMRAAADRMWFVVDPAAGAGLARVATLVSEVETPNIYRGVQ